MCTNEVELQVGNVTCISKATPHHEGLGLKLPSYFLQQMEMGNQPQALAVLIQDKEGFIPID
jgi:hypothetical protein